ncbi:unnamed protein product [Caenorhabditis brenneri]
MIPKKGWLLVVFAVVTLLPSNCSSEPPAVFCDDTIGKFTAIGGNLVLTNLEFPIMAAVPAGSSASADAAIPKVMHPCYSLSNFNNYKNQLYDIFDYGDFSTTICAKQCAHFVDAARITCGDRRPPPTYLVGSVLGPVRKINCSDWALPLTAKGVKDGISLTFTYQTYEAGKGTDLDPPYTLNNLSIKHLDEHFIKGLHMKPIVDPAKTAQSLTEMEELLDILIDRHPEIIHVGFGNQVSFYGDAFRNQSKYYPPKFVPTEKFWTTLGKVPSLNSLALAMIQITGKENIPSSMLKVLKAVAFYDVTLTSIPSWVASDQLQFLEFSATLSDETDMKVLDQLPALEHFLLQESSITSIKSPFLAKSSKLLSLTLQCNAISSIASGAFDHFSQLKYLNLAGNRIVTLPKNLLINMNNLLTLDLKAMDNTTISTFNEVVLTCQSNLGPSAPSILDAMPVIPSPGNLMALDVRGQRNFVENDRRFLKDFRKLEILNIGNLGLTNLQNMSLETLCELTDLNLVSNPLSDKEWIPEDVFVNLNLQRFRLGIPNSITAVPDTLVAFMRISSQISFSVPASLATLDFYRRKMDCEFDKIATATKYGYQMGNKSCEDYVNTAVENIRAMEMLKMENTCT